MDAVFTSMFRRRKTRDGILRAAVVGLSLLFCIPNGRAQAQVPVHAGERDTVWAVVPETADERVRFVLNREKELLALPDYTYDASHEIAVRSFRTGGRRFVRVTRRWAGTGAYGDNEFFHLDTTAFRMERVEVGEDLWETVRRKFGLPDDGVVIRGPYEWPDRDGASPEWIWGWGFNVTFPSWKGKYMMVTGESVIDREGDRYVLRAVKAGFCFPNGEMEDYRPESPVSESRGDLDGDGRIDRLKVWESDSCGCVRLHVDVGMPYGWGEGYRCFVSLRGNAGDVFRIVPGGVLRVSADGKKRWRYRYDPETGNLLPPVEAVPSEK